MIRHFFASFSSFFFWLFVTLPLQGIVRLVLPQAA
jgi:hypothetical protein